MFKVNAERIEAKADLYVLWDSDDIKEYYFSDDLHFDETVFESDSYQQAKIFFDCEKSDCKTFFDGIYLKAEVICLYNEDELLELYSAPLEK